MNQYCHDIHHNLAIDYVNGKMSIGPCCQSGRINHLSGSVQQLWNHPSLIQLRKENIEGKLTTQFCQSCSTLESAGITSRRQTQNMFYKDWQADSKTIRSLDIQLGNLCNLKCVICGPTYSTAWISDYKKLGRTVPVFAEYDKAMQFDLLDVSELQDLELVHFWGGEPLIDNKHLKVLEVLDAHNLLANCRITYNTNGTHRVSDRVLELWSKAKLVELYFSIDDIENRFEYQRFPAKWDNIVDNLKWYYDVLPSNHLFYITCVVSYMNIWTLPELVTWHNTSFSHNRLGDATQFSIQPALGDCAINCLPTKAKDYLIEKLASNTLLSEFLNLYTSQDDYIPTHFINYVNQLDSVRGTNWRTALQQASEVLGA